MPAFRHLVLAHRHLAALICIAALALRIVIPTGYMISSDHGRIAIILCPGVVAQPTSMPMTMVMEMPGVNHAMPEHAPSKEHGKPEMPCAFASLSAQALGGDDVGLLVAALAVVAAIALFAAPRSIIPSVPHLRPPLRGPPLIG